MWRKILWIITAIVVLALIFSIVSIYVSPAEAGWISLCPFALKYILAAVALVTVIWIFCNYKIAIPLAIVAFVGFKYFSHEYSIVDKALDDKADFKVMSYNVKDFGILEPGSKELRKKIVDTISFENPDILCLQEAYWHNKSAEYPTIDALVQNMNAKSYHKLTLAHFNFGDGGLAVVSRYPIVNVYTYPFEGTANGFMYVDIVMNDDTVRLYNCHLQSILINDDEVDIRKSDGLSNRNADKAKNLFAKYTNCASRRAIQVETLVATLDTCPYSVLLCGDFNDVPLSYTRFSIMRSGNRLRDTFMERGSGNGRTFTLKDSDFRIDYIMHSNEFKCLRHKVLDFCIADDHYPVVAEFKR